jgi:AraC family transcriptional regulator of adaptative response/methylated-DNA-[protein]-cysteine methyltransferase
MPEKRAPERITYAFADTAVDRILVAMSEGGVVEVSFVESDEQALASASARLRGATLEPDEGAHAEWVAAVVSHVEDPHYATPVPLDLRGTEFQLQLWEALLDIPPGETRSYAEVARAIGRPTAYRAVAQACGANPVGIVVPCHRVIGSDGSLTGFASGLEHKRQLLVREGVST